MVIMKKHQYKCNAINDIIMSIHEICPFCGASVENGNGAGAHVYQEGKVGRLAMIRSIPKLKKEHEKVIITCFSCNSRQVKWNIPEQISLMQNCHRVYNGKLEGVQYINGIREPLFEYIFSLHGPGVLKNLGDEEYQATVKTIILQGRMDLKKLRPRIKRWKFGITAKAKAKIEIKSALGSVRKWDA